MNRRFGIGDRQRAQFDPGVEPRAAAWPASGVGAGGENSKWLELDTTALKGKVIGLPARDDVNFPIQEQLIVELYSK